MQTLAAKSKLPGCCLNHLYSFFILQHSMCTYQFLLSLRIVGTSLKTLQHVEKLVKDFLKLFRTERILVTFEILLAEKGILKF